MQVMIFSKDRACQLHLLLQSIHFFDGIDQHLFEPTILYTASNSEFNDGYTRLMNHHFEAKWIKEEDGNFRNQVLKFVRLPGRFVMFLVDDMVMMNPLYFSYGDLFTLFNAYGTTLSCLSLRLGHNITHQYQSNTPLQQPDFKEGNNPFSVWNRHQLSGMNDFNYALSVDAHIFNRLAILDLLDQTYFTFPNNLEGNLQQWNRTFPALMACQDDSVFVNLPINRVQDKYENKYGESHPMTPEELNQQYLDGKVINFKSLDLNSINGCHQELEVQLV
jgi:hypothetical protein